MEKREVKEKVKWGGEKGKEKVKWKTNEWGKGEIQMEKEQRGKERGEKESQLEKPEVKEKFQWKMVMKTLEKCEVKK